MGEEGQKTTATMASSYKNYKKRFTKKLKYYKFLHKKYIMTIAKMMMVHKNIKTNSKCFGKQHYSIGLMAGWMDG
jgi:uncharacterized membrane protein